jgi:Tol biopolymer transport system component
MSRAAILCLIGAFATSLLAYTPGSAGAAGEPVLAFSAEAAGNTDVYIAHLDGSDRTRVTTSPGADFDPSWSPDRTKLAYRCQVGTSSDICVANIDGSGTIDITRWAGDEWLPAWSPSGDWIAFFSDHTDLGSL